MSSLPPRGEPIAIIGSGCRFPGSANTPSKLWELLKEPRDLATKIPTDRFNIDSYYHAEGTHFGTTNVKESYFLSDDHKVFDASFFNIQPSEADCIDPQQRLLMETVYEAVEASGLSMETLQGSNTAVYVGLMCNDYSEVLTRDLNFIPTYTATGSARSIMSNRISYFFDWRGPSMTIDTACSSSLVAIHQAVQTLRSGDLRLAVAAGANLIYGPEPYITESNLRMLSPSGRSRMWDADADGYARGEATGALILKRLSNAIKDGDHIECVIRETGVNQDGRTKGITMPSEVSQADLIASTYAHAGLNPHLASDRCQYFEAHGTGTSVGDPKEAEAVFNSFFGPSSTPRSSDDILHIGSIKTVVGHTEGTAGIAGVLKASLAIQHGIIPPNLHFNKLNPAIEPFYGNLRIPTKAIPWPIVPEGQVRRASVNSFGFGGTNAHAILEEYIPSTPIQEEKTNSEIVLTPFVFSATSEKSLIAVLKTFSDFFKSDESISLPSLSATLARRSPLAFKASFSALTAESLYQKIDAKIASLADKSSPPISIKSSKTTPNILGVFTGQGAQWASMGKELILSSKLVQETIAKLEESLYQLPSEHRPTWSLRAEMLADAKTSRISEAALSQPLCTAIQIALVDLLKASGVKFDAVVGHSSGEIAAAYTVGFISAHDAIRIAYYRGLFAKLACGADGKRGAMMAVGTSFEDATEICELEEFEGRISLAASNSSSSITLSGDADAIEEVKEIFEEEKKFARVLKIDTAYHSHHILLCSEQYMDALKACKIQVHHPSDDSCTWFSSVHNGEKVEFSEALKDTYWKDNMVSSVLFSQAVTSALENRGPYTLVLEVGPHPALKGPAKQTIQEKTDSEIPYIGTLSRGNNDIEAFSEMLGYIWSYLGPSSINFSSYNEVCTGSKSVPEILKDLPTYAWDHDRSFWIESRRSMLLRTKGSPFHPLLGSRLPENTDGEIRWTNIISPKKQPWLEGHVVQNQRVFPAAAYVSMALESAMIMAGEKAVNLIEVLDLRVLRGNAFEDDTTGVETIFVLSNITTHSALEQTMTADFAAYTCLNKVAGNMVPMADGKVQVILGPSTPTALPTRQPEDPTLAAVDEENLYIWLADLGYVYTGPFKAMSSLRRKLDKAAGLVRKPEDESRKELLIHPALFDASFQATFVAYCVAGDGRLWSLRLPTAIKKITINPSLCGSALGQQVLFDAELTDSEADIICGDVDVFTEDGQHGIMKVEGIRAVPFSVATEADDSQLFSEAVWGVDGPDGVACTKGERATEEEIRIGHLCERVAYYYLRTLGETVPVEERQKLKIPKHQQALFDSVEEIMRQAGRGSHPYAKREWNNDTKEDIEKILIKFADNPDFKIMRAVGENIAAVIRGETTILENMTKDNMLDEIYKSGLGFDASNTWMSRMVAQLAHRYPHMKILEIGAGTGGSTKKILPKLQHAFSSYTYTDISTGFFERAQDVFKDYASRMIFKVLDIEKEPEAQGFQDNSYDLIIAANVLHATKSLTETMAHVRQLLKPGGYLFLLEITNNGPMRTGFVMGGLPGWWVGVDDGRRFAPTISLTQWNTLLRKTGFSGVDTSTPEDDSLPYPFSVFAAQAIDDNVKLIRKPLASSAPETTIEHLLIIGGQTLPVSKLAEEASDLLGRNCNNISMVDRLEDLHETDISPMTTVLCLTELDEPMFQDMTEEKWEAVKRLFDLSHNVLWATKGCQGDQPYANMTIGLYRSVFYELPHLRMQFIDIESSQLPTARLLSEMLLRLQITDAWSKTDTIPELLWTTEPELIWDAGKMQVLRMIPTKSRNNRYNSSRRLITKEVESANAVVSLQNSEGVRFLREEKSAVPEARFDYLGRALDQRVDVKFSSASTVKVVASGRHCNPLFLALGHPANSPRETVLVLSECNASSINVPDARLLPCRPPAGKEGKFLRLVASDLLAQGIIGGLASGNTLVVNEPEAALANALIHRAEQTNVNLVLTTASAAKQVSPWVSIHPRTAIRSIKAVLPIKVNLFIDFATTATGSLVGSRIRQCLPKFCVVEGASSFFEAETLAFDPSSPLLTPLLQTSATYALTVIQEETAEALQMVPAKDVVNASDLSASAIIDWTSSSEVSVRIEAVDSKDLFVPTKTYWLVGLTRDLGMSLCQWMVKHGAKYIVMTSRTPKIDSTWLADLKSQGAVISVLPMDVTSRESVHEVYNTITSTLPPIGGVANAAMVLVDHSFPSMDIATLTAVTKPKVEGTQYLDELFQENTLDFFVLFSSLACILGNSGQSNYAAANMFMTAMASQRRKRGLAASVMNISGILGVGFVSRAGEQTQRQLARIGFMSMSESDFHQMFAEAVIGGVPGSEYQPELTTGLRIISTVEENMIPWFKNPKFGHFVRDKEGVIAKKDSRQSTVSLRAQLLTVTNKQAATDVMKESFASKIQTNLQLSSDDVVDVTTPLIELGVDSLVAVDVRSWFMKELGVDMPVLKVLGGASIADLIDDAFDKLEPELIPNMGSSETTDPVIKITEDKTPGIPTSNSSENISISKSHSSISLAAEGGTSTPAETVSSHSGSEKDGYVVIPTPLNKTLRSVPMSFGQIGFWFLRNYLEDVTTYNIACLIRLQGNLRVEDLANAVQVISQRHEALRTSYTIGPDRQPLQNVLEHSLLRLECQVVDDDEAVLRKYEEIRDHAYDLEHGETTRMASLSLSPTSHAIILGYHHINMDGVGLQIFFSDLEKAYNRSFLSPRLLQYPDYALKQQQDLDSGKMKSELAYWHKEFSTFPPTLPLLPFSKLASRKPVDRYDAEIANFIVNPSLAARINATCRKYKTTSFHFFLATFKALLYRYLDVEDVCIGMADANRTDADSASALGLFLNLLPIRLRTPKTQTFVEALKEARTKAHMALANGRLPFGVLLEELAVTRAATHSPLFQAFIDYRQGTSEKKMWGGCELEAQEFEAGRISYDLSLDVIENPGGSARVMMLVQRGLYTKTDAEVLLRSYVCLLEAFSEVPEVVIGRPRLHREVNVQVALQAGKGRIHKREWPETLIHRVEELELADGSRIALKDPSRTLTYTQMIARSKAIALALQESGVVNGCKVAIFQEATAEWICSLLGIMRIGGIYVPLDLRNPLSRLSLILQTCKPSALLVHNPTLKNFPALGTTSATIINIDLLPLSTPHPVPILAQPSHIALTLFTSGSTGTPKGVAIPHSALSNQIEINISQFGLGPQRSLQQSALTFDISLEQIFVGLCTGGSVFIAPPSTRGDPVTLTQLIKEEKITYTFATPSEYALWLRYGAENLVKCDEWTSACCGGEKLSSSLVWTFKSLDLPQLHIYNSCGPTEVMISSEKLDVTNYASSLTTTSVPSETIIPAGIVLPNYAIYIVDSNFNPLPLGIPGEIIIGGASLGQYLDNPSLTSKQFVSAPFIHPEHLALGWNKVYKSGDFGRLGPNGEVFVLGRIGGDNQVKLRGNRIELGDVENAVLKSSKGALVEVVASIRGDPQYLVAHVVFSKTYAKDEETRQKLLGEILSNLPVPTYMVPALLIPLASMPLSVHLKTDRKAIAALPLPSSTASSSSSPSKLTGLEQQLKSIWEDIIPDGLAKTAMINGDTDFFQVGGNSLLAIRLQARLREVFNVSLPLVELFGASKLGAMAAKIRSTPALTEIDWDEETSISNVGLPEGISITPTTATMTATGNIMLITGATGHLGRHFLPLLITDPSISSIHLVAVRPNSTKAHLLPTSEKITIHNGDLSDPLLGLSPTTFSLLASTVTSIIHIGANRSFWESYYVMRATNFDSTKSLVNLAFSRKIPIHFFSSGAVGEGSWRPPKDGSEGYVSSKWASEEFLKKSGKEFGVPISVYRTTAIPSMKTKPPTSTLLAGLVSLAKSTKTLPVTAGWTGSFDLINVDTVASSLYHSILSKSEKKTGIEYVNFEGEMKLGIKELGEWMEKEIWGEGKAYERVEGAIWIGRIKEVGWEWMVGSQDVGRVVEGDEEGGMVSRR